MYTFTMVGCTLFKLCHCKCAKAYLREILSMSRLWHDLMAHGHTVVLRTKISTIWISGPRSKSPTWIEPMVVINSQPWGIGHWFVLKRVCVHCIGMKATYFSDSFLSTYICQLIPKLTNHINKKVNILMAPLITKIKQNLHQKIQEKLGVPQRICQ